MGRKVLVKNSIVVSFRIDQYMWELLEEIAEVETNKFNRQVSRQELIRDALYYVYVDNERLRECFKRSRSVATKLTLKKYIE